MITTNSTLLDAAAALEDDAGGMDEYLRSERARAAIQRGLADIEEGRVRIGGASLEAELARRATLRREKH